jgi:hypothetical protein
VKHTLEIPNFVSGSLPDDALKSAQVAVGRLRDWASTVPEQSKFYMNKRPNFMAFAPPGIRSQRLDLNVASAFFDVHSVLAGQCIVKTWRASQLVEGLAWACGHWNITMAAASARALVETASAWFIESTEIIDLWKSIKGKKVAELADVHRARNELYAATTQMFAGTRLTSMLKVSKDFQRTNILTLIKKATNRLDRQDLWDKYEALCDSVHPSWGSSECFWQEVGLNEQLNQMRVLLNKRCAGEPGDPAGPPKKPGSGLGLIILESSSWACDRLLTDLMEFHRMCVDICLTCRIFDLPSMDYWQVVRPTGLYDPCACGSNKKTRFCHHKFGSE